VRGLDGYLLQGPIADDYDDPDNEPEECPGGCGAATPSTCTCLKQKESR
jgi:hypothetical protein